MTQLSNSEVFEKGARREWAPEEAAIRLLYADAAKRRELAKRRGLLARAQDWVLCLFGR
jgi:hypothetical protein